MSCMHGRYFILLDLGHGVRRVFSCQIAGIGYLRVMTFCTMCIAYKRLFVYVDLLVNSLYMVLYKTLLLAIRPQTLDLIPVSNISRILTADRYNKV